MAVNQTEKKSVGGTCNVCQLTQIDLGDHVVDGQTTGETWDILTPEITRRGWKVNVKPNNARELVCPGCVLELERRETMELLPYPKLAECPKCRAIGYEYIHATFCMGLNPNCELGVGREHMHLRCSRCQFGWITATAVSPFFRRVTKIALLALAAMLAVFGSGAALIAYQIWKGQ